jgi:hypothetical protein
MAARRLRARQHLCLHRLQVHAHRAGRPRRHATVGFGDLVTHIDSVTTRR